MRWLGGKCVAIAVAGHGGPIMPLATCVARAEVLTLPACVLRSGLFSPLRIAATSVLLGDIRDEIASTVVKTPRGVHSVQDDARMERRIVTANRASATPPSCPERSRLLWLVSGASTAILPRHHSPLWEQRKLPPTQPSRWRYKLADGKLASAWSAPPMIEQPCWRPTLLSAAGTRVLRATPQVIGAASFSGKSPGIFRVCAVKATLPPTGCARRYGHSSWVRWLLASPSVLRACFDEDARRSAKRTLLLSTISSSRTGRKSHTSTPASD